MDNKLVWKWRCANHGVESVQYNGGLGTTLLYRLGVCEREQSEGVQTSKRWINSWIIVQVIESFSFLLLNFRISHSVPSI